MEQLTTLDASFLALEDSDPNASLAIGVVAIVAGAPPSIEQLQTVLAERIRSIPHCTQVLRRYPLDMTAPQWIDDPHFDITHHVRRIALPRPGDDGELFGAVAHALERRLSRDRPLWEFWLIEGLKGNRWAFLVKIHRCMADGAGGIQLLTALCDETAAEPTASPVDSTKVATLTTDRRPMLTRAPLSWAATLLRAPEAVASVAARTITGAAEIATSLLRPAERTSLTGPTSNLRRYAAVRVPVTSIENVCRKFEVTPNDVVFAAITEGFRAVLLHRGEKPRASALRALVPVSVSVRSTDGNQTCESDLSVILPYLPIEQDDPVQRLRTVHDRLTRITHTSQPDAASIMLSAANYLPFMLSAWTIRLIAWLPHRSVATLATHLTGPNYRLKLMGNNIERLLPIPAIALQLRTGVAVLGYTDDLVFGITADYDSTPDLEELAAGIELAVARLEALSRDSVLLFAR